MLTVSFVVKVCRLLWATLPFLATVVFNDRPVRDVIKENLYFTIMFCLFAFTTTIAVWTTNTLSRLKMEHFYLERQYNDVVADRDRALEHVRLQRQELEMCTHENDYDPYRALRSLDGTEGNGS